MKYYKDLTNEEARDWLMRKDKEAAEFWRESESEELRQCVFDNIRDFGEDDEVTIIPTYSETKDLKPGLYLGLMHGRDTVDQQMNFWGFNGPVIGPLNYAHTTYGSEVKLEFTDAADKFIYFSEADAQEVIAVHADGLLMYGGKYYGDWTVFNHKGD